MSPPDDSEPGVDHEEGVVDGERKQKEGRHSVTSHETEAEQKEQSQRRAARQERAHAGDEGENELGSWC